MGRDRLVRRLVRNRFLVTTDSEESFDGVLTGWDVSFFTFEDVSSVTALPGGGERRVHLDSALWVPRARIKYMQAVTP